MTPYMYIFSPHMENCQELIRLAAIAARSRSLCERSRERRDSPSTVHVADWALCAPAQIRGHTTAGSTLSTAAEDCTFVALENCTLSL